MIILAVVTINVALNGGLFETAKGATTNTQIESEREQLLSAIVPAYDTKTGKISKSKLETNLGAGWKVEGAEGGPYTVTSPKGNVFTVDENGKITPKDNKKTIEYEYTLKQIRELALDSNNGGQIDEETDEETGNKTINIILPFSAFWKEETPDSIKNGVERDDMGTRGYYKYEVTVENLPYIDVPEYNGERGLVFTGLSPDVARDGMSFETTENCIMVIASQLTDSDDYSQIKIKIREVEQEIPEPEPEFNTFTLENLVDAGTVRVESEKYAYFDIPIDDFNTIIGQDIRTLEGYLCKLNSESSKNVVGASYDKYYFNGYIRIDLESTDINVYDGTDAVITGLLIGKKCPNQEISRTDKKLKWMLENGSTAAESPIVYIYLLKNKETNEEIATLEIMKTGEYLYHSKEEIPENLLKVNLKPISSKKVNELTKKYGLSE